MGVTNISSAITRAQVIASVEALGLDPSGVTAIHWEPSILTVETVVRGEDGQPLHNRDGGGFVKTITTYIIPKEGRT